MGSLQADEFAEAVRDGQLSLEAALTWHLESNHYPPRGNMHAAALAAIQAVQDGNFDDEIALPPGVLHKGVSETAPAIAIVDALHLDSFLDLEDQP